MLESHLANIENTHFSTNLRAESACIICLVSTDKQRTRFVGALYASILQLTTRERISTIGIKAAKRDFLDKEELL